MLCNVVSDCEEHATASPVVVDTFITLRLENGSNNMIEVMRNNVNRPYPSL